MPSKKKKTKIESLINHLYQLLSFLEIHQKTRSIREEIKSIKKKVWNLSHSSHNHEYSLFDIFHNY